MEGARTITPAWLSTAGQGVSGLGRHVQTHPTSGRLLELPCRPGLWKSEPAADRLHHRGAVFMPLASLSPERPSPSPLDGTPAEAEDELSFLRGGLPTPNLMPITLSVRAPRLPSPHP